MMNKSTINRIRYFTVIRLNIFKKNKKLGAHKSQPNQESTISQSNFEGWHGCITYRLKKNNFLISVFFFFKQILKIDYKRN